MKVNPNWKVRAPVRLRVTRKEYETAEEMADMGFFDYEHALAVSTLSAAADFVSARVGSQEKMLKLLLMRLPHATVVDVAFELLMAA